MDKLKTINWPVIMQMFVIAGLTTLASGYVSGRIVESKMEYVIQEIRRIDTDAKETRGKLEDVQMRQSAAISKADSIHSGQDRRIDRLELRR